jgi:hypothetical protein
MSNLGGKELYKYDWRAEVFIKKLKNGELFDTTTGKIKLLPATSLIKAIEKRESLTNVPIIGTDGKKYKISDFVKTAEFGGKGERGGVVKEDMALQSLRDQINAAKTKEKASTINIKIGTKIYKVFDAASTPGTPKSDFHLIDIDGKEIVWISHKDGKTEKDFQQWGGMSQRSEPDIYSHKESQKFINDMKDLYPDGLPNATTVARKIIDPKLRNMSAYGNQFGKVFGRQNVTLMLQGAITLAKQGSAYTIKGYHTHLNGEALTQGYEPVFMAIYKGDRSDFDIKGTRVVIAPAGCRKVSYYI